MSTFNSIIARRMALPGILFYLICVYGCATGPQIQEAITLPFEISSGDWEHGYSTENDFQRVIEFVRSGQTVDSWTELFTVQTLNKQFDLGSVEDQIVSLRDGFEENCPGTTLNVIRQMADGVIYEATIVNCEQGADEQTLVRILDGDYNRFAVHYAVRETTKMTPERRAKWLEQLLDLRITKF